MFPRNIVAVWIFLLAGCSAIEPLLPEASYTTDTVGPFPKQEIIEFHGGSTIHGRYTSGGLYSEFHTADGRVVLSEYDGSLHRGTWSAEDGIICYTYPDLNAGTPFCFEVRGINGDVAHIFASGARQGQAAAIIVGRSRGNASGIPVE